MAKMGVDRMIERVMLKVQDDSFDDDFILEAFNQCNANIASDIYIKELATVSDVTVLAGDNSVALPSDYHRNLSYCLNKSISSCKVTVYRSRRLIDKKYPTFRGTRVIAVAPDGVNLYCKGTPSSNTILTIYYHRLPTELVVGGQFPFYIPEGKVYDLFFNYAVSQIWDYIEDGIEGERVNTEYHENRYNIALSGLKLLIGEDPDEPFIPDGYNSHFNMSY